VKYNKRQKMIPKVYLVIFLTVCTSFILSENQACREGTHTMYVALTTLTNSSLKGLKKFSYTFFLLPSFEQINNFHLVFEAHFPVNINIELSPEILYVFQPLYNFCLNDLLNNRQKTLIGNLEELKTKSSILTGIWIEIDEILYKEEIKKEMLDITKYLLMSKYQSSNSEVLIMKHLTLSDSNSYFQIVRARITEKDNVNSLLHDELEVGTQIMMTLDSDKSNVILQEKQVYTGLISDKSSRLKRFIFDNIINFVCLMSTTHDGHFDKECDYNIRLK
jgi:hypothetical protein